MTIKYASDLHLEFESNSEFVNSGTLALGYVELGKESEFQGDASIDI